MSSEEELTASLWFTEQFIENHGSNTRLWIDAKASGECSEGCCKKMNIEEVRKKLDERIA